MFCFENQQVNEECQQLSVSQFRLSKRSLITISTAVAGPMVRVHNRVMTNFQYLLLCALLFTLSLRMQFLGKDGHFLINDKWIDFMSRIEVWCSFGVHVDRIRIHVFSYSLQHYHIIVGQEHCSCLLEMSHVLQSAKHICQETHNKINIIL